ncbi:MAG: GAF domain-containing protein [Rubrivivax sp.]|nr:GAF domain-containing protein [Rubrivivax sp.]
MLDTPPDPVLDGLVRSAAAVIGCPIALVSLVDVRRQWFKARVGLEANQWPRETAFCAHAILEGGLLEVPDAQLDPRFADSPLVTGEPHVRFYAGVPLDVDGHRIGTLCVIDSQPSRLNDAQRQWLGDLARAVEHWLVSWRQYQELRQAIVERQQAEQKARSLLEELLRWQEAMLGREDRVQQLKIEVNELLAGLGQPVRYGSQTKP